MSSENVDYQQLCVLKSCLLGLVIAVLYQDPFYDSDVYRDAGGDGSGNWLYKLVSCIFCNTWSWPNLCSY